MRRGRKPGQMVHCTCVKCGEVEMRSGCTSHFTCSKCHVERGWVDSPQARAHRAVANAIRTGALLHSSNFACVDCGKPATEYDHRDYAKPLEVDPTCRGCNRRRGPAQNHPVTRWNYRKQAGLLWQRSMKQKAA